MWMRRTEKEGGWGRGEEAGGTEEGGGGRMGEGGMEEGERVSK